MNTKELRELLEKATPGPWTNRLNTPYGVPCCSIHAQDRIPGRQALMQTNFGNVHNGVAQSWQSKAKAHYSAEYAERTANATLIVALRNAAPLLLDEIDALRARVAELEAEAEWQGPIMHAVKNYCVLLVSRPDEKDTHEKWRLRICEAFDNWAWRITPAELAAAEARRQQPPPLPSGKKE